MVRVCSMQINAMEAVVGMDSSFIGIFSYEKETRKFGERIFFFFFTSTEEY